MISEMGRVGTFTATPVSENQKSGRGESGYEWILRVTYAQRSRAARPAEEDGREAGAERDTSTSAGGLE